MKKIFVYCFFLLATITVLAQSDFEKRSAAEALEAFETQKFEEAAKLYKKLAERYPNKPDYAYREAFSYYWLGKYGKVIRMGLELIDRNESLIHYYRLTANAYDLNGMYKDAMTILQTGAKRYPYSGELYFDMGVIENIRGNKAAALEYWEQGIKAAPYYAENYYWATKTYAQSDEKVWAIMYGEMFLNVERGTERFTEISSLLLFAYRDLLREIPNINLGEEAVKLMPTNVRIDHAYDWFIEQLQQQNTISLSQVPDSILNIKKPNNKKLVNNELIKLNSKKAPIQLNRTQRNEFEQAYLQILAMLRDNGILNLTSSGRTEDGDYNLLQAVSFIRSNFIGLWMQAYDKDIPVPLFQWQFELQERNLLEAYNFWLMSNGDPNYFIKWRTNYTDDFQNFLDRLIAKPLKIDFNNYFLRTNYIKE